jgi:hypothetical protein
VRITGASVGPTIMVVNISNNCLLVGDWIDSFRAAVSHASTIRRML